MPLALGRRLRFPTFENLRVACVGLCTPGLLDLGGLLFLGAHRAVALAIAVLSLSWVRHRALLHRGQAATACAADGSEEKPACDERPSAYRRGSGGDNGA